ncbi:MAG: hypothetical protein SFX18_00050 [Pirellulales bacterium]|nr:hypothetical protein [Pirellulales bacterium]
MEFGVMEEWSLVNRNAHKAADGIGGPEAGVANTLFSRDAQRSAGFCLR